MISKTTSKFQSCYHSLPIEIQKSADKAYQKWKGNPYHESLRFKQIHDTQPIYSVRISLNWRALGIKQDNVVIWFWIGSHAEYDKLIQSI